MSSPGSGARVSSQGAGLDKGDTADKLLPMQQVPPLHVTDVYHVNGKSPYGLVPGYRSCQNDVEVNDKAFHNN